MSERPTLVGHGPDHVLVLHGWLSGARSWARMWPYLDTKRFTYAFLDCRGYGARQQDDGCHTIMEAARDAVAAADELGWADFYLLGHSMGGMAIQYMLTQAAERVRALIGVCPVPASGSPMDDARLSFFSRAVDDRSARKELLNVSTGNQWDDAWLEALVSESLETTSPPAMHKYLMSWTGTDFHDEIAGSPTPAYVIVGSYDPAYPVSRVESTWTQWYPSCEIREIDRAGHYPMAEAPEELAALIEAAACVGRE